MCGTARAPLLAAAVDGLFSTRTSLSSGRVGDRVEAALALIGFLFIESIDRHIGSSPRDQFLICQPIEDPTLRAYVTKVEPLLPCLILIV